MSRLQNISSKIETLDNITSAGRDCIKENHPCMNTSDCEDICQINNVVLFECNEKSLICEPQSFVEKESDSVNVVCNESHGFIRVLTVSEFGGAQWNCLNSLSNYFSKEDKLQRHVCNRGELVVDVNTSYPKPTDCICSSGYLLGTFNQSDTPRCIPLILNKFLPSFDLLQ